MREKIRICGAFIYQLVELFIGEWNDTHRDRGVRWQAAGIGARMNKNPDGHSVWEIIVCQSVDRFGAR